MAVKKESRRAHNPVKASGREAMKRAAQLAPPEERDDRDAANKVKRDGELAIDTGELKLPESLMVEADERTRGLFYLEPVVIFILICLLAYIAFIAYLISIQPAQ